jgi:hypothetical protein
MASDETLEDILREFADRIRAHVRREIVETLTSGARVGNDVVSSRGKRRRRGAPRASGPGSASDEKQRTALIQTIVDFPKGATFGEIHARNPLAKEKLRALLQGLVAEKLLKKAGVRRGVRYSIPRT